MIRNSFLLISLIFSGCIEKEPSPDAGILDAGPLTPRHCAEVCGQDSDCDGDVIWGHYECIEGRCEAIQCENSDDCLAAMNLWTQPCGVASPCGEHSTCITVNGNGRCALAPPCPGLSETPQTSVAGEMVMVCTTPYDWTCIDQRCDSPSFHEAPCESDLNCLEPLVHCQDGKCVCTEASCAEYFYGGVGKVCLPEGKCGCLEDIDCSGQGHTTCYDHVCGCATDADCASATKAHTGTVMQCL